MNLQSYIDLGWSVFPVKGPHYAKDYDDSKAPALQSWKPFQSRKPTTQEITQWQQILPKMSLAVTTGPLNNLFVVDIDGNDWMLRFPNADFGVTWKSKTTRGCHFYYQWEDWMLDIPTTGSKLDNIKGFDIRGQGGYVVIPNDNDPSRSWEVHPTDHPLLKMPDWIKTFILSCISKKKTSKHKLAEVSEGNRHQTFLSYAGKLQRAGMVQEEIIQILSPVAEKVGFKKEMQDIVQDVAVRYPIDRREKLRPESMEVLLSESEPPLAWLIEGLWTDKSRGFIAGHPGVGKTWIALDMLLSVSTGGLCLAKYKPAYRAPCLLIEEEASRLNLQRRIHALSRSRGLKPSDLKDLHHITRQFAKIPQDAPHLVEIIRSLGVKFVVFDSLRRFHSANENSSNEMQAVLDAFALIGTMGDCSVLLIHHLNKGNVENSSKSIFERMRGSSDFWAWRDCIIGVEGEEESDLCQCSFQFRDAQQPAPIQVKRHFGELTGTISLEALSLSESPEFIAKCEAAIAYIKLQFGGAFMSSIAKELEGRKSDNLKAIKLMLKKGILEPLEGGKVGVPN